MTYDGLGVHFEVYGVLDRKVKFLQAFLVKSYIYNEKTRKSHSQKYGGRYVNAPGMNPASLPNLRLHLLFPSQRSRRKRADGEAQVITDLQ
jgi:hypothetical protein